MTNCDPTMGLVSITCGIFVSSSKGKDKSPGSQSEPVKTLAHAIELASGQNHIVYACGESFREAVSVPGGTVIYGALDCSKGWTYDAAKRSSIDAPADAVALTLGAGASITVQDFAVSAADASIAGGSSIAVFANGATATLERCAISAGKGMPGSPGAAQPGVVTPSTANGGEGGGGCTSPASVGGGESGLNTCGGIKVNGGVGGEGTNGGGQAGLNGLPMGMTDGMGDDGLGGAAEDTGSCKAGHSGDDGTAGAVGAGAVGVGALSASGFSAASAMAGSPGVPGQGGGGGGAATACGSDAGPSGGGGGAGGCAGAGGTPGTSGGSSIGVASFTARVAIKDSTVMTAAGANGGLGGNGQVGGGGGPSGAAVGSGACAGGGGGKGGNGGPGGGGAGGHSLAIAFQGGTPPTTPGTTLAHDTPGSGAAGGDGTTSIGGSNGLGCMTLDLTTAASCVP
jgi:hypothetical protein